MLISCLARSLVASALGAICAVAAAFHSAPTHAVRVNPDGHGQVLIYPYYTARSTRDGYPYVTAFSVTNTSTRSKAMRVRVHEARAGADVLDFNLYLAAYEVWTAGIVAAGAGAGIFTANTSCTTPRIGASAANPTMFGNAAYLGDVLGVTLDRTYEGYLEILEMGAIDPASALVRSVARPEIYSVPAGIAPTCANLPSTAAVPAGLSRPAGGLLGNVSYINVNQGTDYSVDAIALSDWSDKVQWSIAGDAHPNLADVSPATSFVANVEESGDITYITRWEKGRDAISALFMSTGVVNDFTVEPIIKGATDWALTMPTKRFYVSGSMVEKPFGFSTAVQSSAGV